MIYSLTCAEPPICEKEILRYAGCREAEENTLALVKECLDEIKDKLVYKVCYRELRVEIHGDECRLEGFVLRSASLAKNLCGCDRVVVFAATVGIEIDRLITKYGRLSPSKALLLQAIGAERIEAVCDSFCQELEKKNGFWLRPRFSPGYGDLSLEGQKALFSLLGCEKRIGLTLTDSLLMSPTKSVTAIAGISDTPVRAQKGCSICDADNCVYRGRL